MSSSFISRIVPKLPWVLAAGLAGALAFVVAQKVAGFPMHIAEFMGSEIVRRGGYGPGLTGPIGWGVHLAVAVSYAGLYAVIVLAPFFPRERVARWGLALGVTLLLAWISTLLTSPAIAITLGYLSGKGFPATVPPLNTSLGFVFWNHVGFFSISFVITVVARDLITARAESASAPLEGDRD